MKVNLNCLLILDFGGCSYLNTILMVERKEQVLPGIQNVSKTLLQVTLHLVTS
jgi:hypothetical protein